MIQPQLKPRGAGAVMASRVEPPDSLDYFPTPPWATRAFLDVLDGWFGCPFANQATAWEPACGEGHMAEVLRERFASVIASDVFDYGYGKVVDFLDESEEKADWIITNPPFKTAIDFALLGLERAKLGVALLVRTAWLEGGDRYARLFSQKPPTLVAQFAERVPMTKGRWDPDATTATAYCWIIWTNLAVFSQDDGTLFRWIPPGQRKALTRSHDRERFGIKTDAPLLVAE